MALEEKYSADISFIQSIVDKDGPDVEDYAKLDAWYDRVGASVESGEISKEELDFLRSIFGDAYLTDHALQGHVYTMPHGYRGDFEIIDMIYSEHISKDEKFSKWDTWFHSLAATKAVRNRKEYFKRLLAKNSNKIGYKVLNLASGPCRDIAEFFEEYPEAPIKIDCLEIDPNAVSFAKGLLEEISSEISFIEANIFRYKTEEKYDLIWSAGLFDYFDDTTFYRILGRYKENLNEGGEIIIGNFHPRNSSRRTMEFGLWLLHHRSESQLTALAKMAGFDEQNIRIEQEMEGVNLFMRIRC